MKIYISNITESDVISYEGRRNRVLVVYEGGRKDVVYAECGNGFIDVDTDRRDIKKIKGVLKGGRLIDIDVHADMFDFIPDVVEKPTRERRPAEPLRVETPETLTPEKEEELKLEMLGILTSIITGLQYAHNLKTLNEVEKVLDEKLSDLCVKFDPSERPLLVKSLAFVRGCKESQVGSCAYVEDFNRAMNIINAAPILLTGTNPLLIPASEKVPRYKLPAGLPPNIIARKDFYRQLTVDRDVSTSAIEDLRSVQLIDVWRIMILKASIEFLKLLRSIFSVLSKVPGLKAIPHTLDKWIEELGKQLSHYIDPQGNVYIGNEGYTPPLEYILRDEAGYTDDNDINNALGEYTQFMQELGRGSSVGIGGVESSNALTYANTIIKFFAAEFPKQYPDKMHLLTAKYYLPQAKDKVMAAIGTDWMHLCTPERKAIMREIEADLRLNFYWGTLINRLESEEGVHWVMEENG